MIWDDDCGKERSTKSEGILLIHPSALIACYRVDSFYCGILEYDTVSMYRFTNRHGVLPHSAGLNLSLFMVYLTI